MSDDPEIRLTLRDLWERPLWVAWRNEHEGDKLKKQPKDPRRRGKNASVSAHSTWAGRVAAADADAAMPKPLGGGVGIMLGPLGDGTILAGVDLDGCREPVTGKLDDWARRIVDRFATYTEVSPSNTGVKVFMRLREADVERVALVGSKTERLPRTVKGHGGHSVGIEYYREKRYFTVTEQWCSDISPEELRVSSVDDVRWLIDVAMPELKGAGAAGAGATGGASEPKAKPKKKKKGAPLPDTPEALIEDVTEALAIIPNDDEHWEKWATDVGMKVFAATTGRGEGYEAWRAWSTKSGLHEDSACRERWDHFKRSPPTQTPVQAYNSLLAMANEVDPDWVKPSERARKDAVVDEMNASYAVVVVGGKAMIMREALSGLGLPDFELMSADSFRLMLMNRKVPVGEKLIPIADVWLNHPRRKQHDGMVFAPGRDVPGHYNFWRGFAVEPRPGSCSRLLAHVRDNVCRGDEALYPWVIGWFAEIFQHPDRKSGTSLVLRGKRGTGKSKVGDVMRKLLGEHAVKATSKRYITGRFNSHLARCLLLCGEECFWAGDKEAESVLKDLITGDDHLIERKNVDPIAVRNYVRLFVTSNADWVIPAGAEERRFAVLDVGEDRMQDHAYFAAIDAEMDTGGYEALLDHLLKFDLTSVNLRVVPKTAALLEQKIASLNDKDAWLLDLLQKGELYYGTGSAATTPADLVHEFYVTAAGRIGARHKGSETELGMYLHKTLPGLTRTTTTYRRHGDDVRGSVYRFPALKRCRDLFEKKVGQAIEWHGPATWLDPPKSYGDGGSGPSERAPPRKAPIQGDIIEREELTRDPAAEAAEQGVPAEVDERAPPPGGAEPIA